MGLQELKLKDTYSSNSDNLVKHFYNPVIEKAVSYDRITGFFSPSVLVVASRGFANLISTGGKIRLISSVQVDDRAYESITGDTYQFDDDFIENFNIDTLKTEIERDYLSIFAWLYQSGQLEMKIAITTKERSMMHQKIGIVTDSSGDSISFSGSNNETPNGWRYNIEQFKVFKSWNPHTTAFFEGDKAEFETLWNNLSKRAKVVKIDDAIKEKLVIKIEKRRKGSIKDTAKRIRNYEHVNKPRISFDRKKDAHFFAENESTQSTKKTSDRSLRPYQQDAIDHWTTNGYKSIFEMATGTGKTFTSINALKKFRKENGYIRAIVVVPLTTLTVQWKNDVEEIIDDVQILNTATAKSWKDTLHSLYINSKLNEKNDFILITTYSMFPRKDFNEALEKLGNDLVLVADEMHTLVTERGTAAASSTIYKYRLGLSATPTRLWKSDESNVVAEIFGANRYTFDISEALERGFLVKFNYHPITVQLDLDEYEEYINLSKDIAQLYASGVSRDENSSYSSKLIARSRIKKNAAAKLPALEQLVQKLKSSDELYQALIYVDNETFLKSLQQLLTKNNVITTKFVGETPLDDRISIISNLRNNKINAIVAIKCLDEGVDIPSARKAFFLSNNTDPREYVQRLGRVLRKDKSSNKKYSDIYDYLVLPPSDINYSSDGERNIARNLIKGEFIRAKFFEALSMNGTESNYIISDEVDKYGFFFEEDELMYNTDEN